MAVSLVASTTGTTTATLPAGTISGDIVVAFAYATSTTAPTLPASWTNITSGTTTMALRVQYRVYDGVWTMPTFTNAARTHALTFRGQHATTPIGVTSCTGTTATNVTWPVVTLQDATGASALIRGCGHTRPDSVITAPANHTSRQAEGTQPGYITHTKNVTTDGAAATSTVSRNTSWTQAQVEIKSAPVATITQAAYRWYDEGTEAGSTPYAAQDTAVTGDITNGDATGTLRIRLQNTSAVVVPGTDDWQLQYEKNASGSWINVSTSSLAAATYDSPNLTNGAVTTNRLTGGTGTFTAGKVSEDALMDDLGWAANNYTELVYALLIKAADLVAADTLRFRVLRNGSTSSMTYTVTPTINLIKTTTTQATAALIATSTLTVAATIPAGVVSQGAYQFTGDVGTEATATPLAAQNTAPTVDLASGDANIRLRTLLQETNLGRVLPTDDWQLRWEKNASGTWNDVRPDPYLVATYAVSNSDNAVFLGDATISRQAQSFMGTGQRLKRIGVQLHKDGTPTATGNITCHLYAHTGTFNSGSSVPTTVLTTSSTSIVATSLPDGIAARQMYYFDFDETFTMVDGTPYFLVVQASGFGNASNRAAVGADTSSPGGNGVKSQFASAAWGTNTTIDLVYEVYGPSGSTVLANLTAPVTDNSPLVASRLTGGTGTYATGEVSKTGLASDLGWPGGGYSEVLYTLTLKAADLADADTIRFRVLRNGVSITQGFVPALTVSKVGVFTDPSSLLGLASWYDADDASTFTYFTGANASEWRDKSGLGRHLAQPDPNFQPQRTGTQNGRTTLTFGGDDHLDTAPFTVSQPFTLFMALDDLAVDYEGWWGSVGGKIQIYTGNANLLYMYADTANAQGLGITQVHSGPHQWVFEFNGASSAAYKDGVLQVAGDAGPAGTTTGWRTAERDLYLAYRLRGELFEVVAYDRVLTTTERQQVEGYLNTKWFVPSGPATVNASVAFSAFSTLTTAAVEEAVAAVPLTAVSTLTATAVRAPQASVAFTATSTLTATAIGVAVAAVPLTATSTLTVGVFAERQATVALTATSTLTATASTLPMAVDNVFYRDTILADGPIAYYRLDEQAGTLTMVDSSANVKNGTYANNPALGVPGGPRDSGAAVALNGSNQYGEVVADPIFNQPTFTVEVWAKYTSTKTQAFMDRIRPSLTGGFMFRSFAGQVDFFMWSSFSIGSVNSPGTINNGQWHHVVVTVDGAASTLYIDGALNATKAHTFTQVPATDGLRVGAARSGVADAYSNFFNGSLDEVAYYAGALTPAQITAHYDAGTQAAPVKATVALTAASTLTATAVVTGTQQAAVALTATSTLTATAVRAPEAAVALTAVSTFTATVIRAPQAAVSFVAVSTLTATAIPVRQASVALTATSTLTAAAFEVAVAAVSLTAVSTLTAAISVAGLTQAAVDLVAVSTLTTTAVRAPQATVSLVAASTLTTTAVRVPQASVALTAVSTFTATAVRESQATVAFAAASLLTVGTSQANRVTSQVQTSWTTLVSVTATRDTTWAVRTSLTTARSTTWAAPAQVTTSRPTTWAVTIPVTVNRGTSWNVDATGSVSASRATSWAALARVTATRASTWETTKQVTAARSSTWTTTVSLTSVRSSTWKALAAVSSARATPWSTLASVTAVRAISWSVLTPVAAARSTSWNVIAQAGVVTASRSTTWNVAALSIPVTASRATTWQTATLITGSRQTFWAARAQVAVARQVVWDVRSTISISQATSWETLVSVPLVTRQTSWKVLAQIVQPRSTTWQTAARVTGTRGTGWNLFFQISSSRSSSWRTSGLVYVTREGQWRVDARVTSTRSTAWNALSNSLPDLRVVIDGEKRAITGVWVIEGGKKRPVVTMAVIVDGQKHELISALEEM